jgi:Ca2+-binding EF-hand superfamily protein
VLDENESKDFIKIVLQMNENMLAKTLGREVREITDEVVG